MNASRRKALLKLAEKVGDIRAELEAARDHEQEYYDNMPESLQAGERGDRAQVSIDALESAAQSLEEVENYIGKSL